MTDIEQTALALLNEVQVERGDKPDRSIDREFVDAEALCRAIEAHEAFRREVSDAVSQYADEFVPADLKRFIITKPDALKMAKDALHLAEQALQTYVENVDTGTATNLEKGYSMSFALLGKQCADALAALEQR